MHVSFLALSVGLLYPERTLGSGGQAKSSGPGPAGESFASRLALTGHFFCVNWQQSNATLLLR